MDLSNMPGHEALNYVEMQFLVHDVISTYALTCNRQGVKQEMLEIMWH